MGGTLKHDAAVEAGPEGKREKPALPRGETTGRLGEREEVGEEEQAVARKARPAQNSHPKRLVTVLGAPAQNSHLEPWVTVLGGMGPREARH